MLKYVVTGAGRSGTGYMSKLLTSVGIPCGHEQVFGLDGMRDTPYQAGSSWLAMPWLADLAADVRVIHLVRHPVKAISSLLTVRALQTEPYAAFIRRHVPRLVEWKTDADRATYYWLKWNQAVEAHADYRHRVEDKPDDLWRFLGISPQGPLFDDKTYNHRPEFEPITLDVGRLESGLQAGLVVMASRYGYLLSQGMQSL